jgi:hypothetical protein
VTIEQDSTHPTGVVETREPGGGPSTAVQAARLRKAHAALAMKKDMATWDEIAEALGYPTGRAALVATELALQHELKTAEGAAFMRRVASERYDKLLKSVWKTANDETSPEHLPYLDRARLLMRDHIDLMGYSMPKQQIVVTPTTRQLEAWVAQAASQDTKDLEEADIFDVDWTEEPPEAIEGPNATQD